MRHIIKAALVPSLLAAIVIPADVIAPQLASARSIEPLLSTETVSTSTPDKQTTLEQATQVKHHGGHHGHHHRRHHRHHHKREILRQIFG